MKYINLIYKNSDIEIIKIPCIILFYRIVIKYFFIESISMNCILIIFY